MALIVVLLMCGWEKERSSEANGGREGSRKTAHGLALDARGLARGFLTHGAMADSVDGGVDWRPCNRCDPAGRDSEQWTRAEFWPQKGHKRSPMHSLRRGGRASERRTGKKAHPDQDLFDRSGRLGAQGGGKLVDMAAAHGGGQRGDAVVVARGEQFRGQQGGGKLVQMPLVGGGMERRVAVIVASEQQVSREMGSGDVFQLAGLGGGVDDRVARLAFENEMVVHEQRRRNLIKVAGDGGGVKDGVTGLGGQQQGFQFEQLGRDLVEVAVERGDMENGFTAEVAFGEKRLAEYGNGQEIERAVFGGFMHERVAEIGAQQ